MLKVDSVGFPKRFCMLKVAKSLWDPYRIHLQHAKPLLAPAKRKRWKQKKCISNEPQKGFALGRADHGVVELAPKVILHAEGGFCRDPKAIFMLKMDSARSP